MKDKLIKKVDKFIAPEISNPIKQKQIQKIVSNLEERRIRAEELAKQIVNQPERKHLFFKEELDSERAKSIKWLGS